MTLHTHTLSEMQLMSRILNQHTDEKLLKLKWVSFYPSLCTPSTFDSLETRNVDQECNDNNINETRAKIPYLKLKDLNGECVCLVSS